MFNREQYTDIILMPVLMQLQMYSHQAISLMLGTIAAESDAGTFIKQVGGPALGVYMMEPKTHDDTWNHYLTNQPVITGRLMGLCNFSKKPQAVDMIFNVLYATAMARIHYWRVQEPIPTELEAQAEYYVRYYNCGGKGTVAKFIDAYNVFMGVKNGRAKGGTKS